MKIQSIEEPTIQPPKLDESKIDLVISQEDNPTYNKSGLISDCDINYSEYDVEYRCKTTGPNMVGYVVWSFWISCYFWLIILCL